MRLLAVLPLLLLGACQVSKENNETRVQLNADKAQSGAEALLNEAEKAAGNAAERLERVADKAGEKVDKIDVGNINVGVDLGNKDRQPEKPADKPANSQ